MSETTTQSALMSLVERETGLSASELESKGLLSVVATLCDADLDSLAEAARKLEPVDPQGAELVRRIYHRRIDMARLRVKR